MGVIRQFFAEFHAVQCGFCTPGMLATAYDVVKRLPNPDRTRIRLELSGNLCRCTGYLGIIDAIEAAIERVHGPARSEAAE
jgi:carbon-monoxide dehydrogenase small subunit